MEETESKTKLVAWIDNNTIFVGGNKKYIVMNPFTKNVEKQESFSPKYGRILDIAVNKTHTQYATSYENGIIECYDSEEHLFLHRRDSKTDAYIPITFSQQQTEQIMYGLVAGDGIGITRLVSHNNRLRYFFTLTCTPISCHPCKNIILFHRNTPTSHQICIINDYTNISYHITDVECQSIRGTRFSLDGNHILINFGNKLKIYPNNKIKLFNTIETTTEAAFIAFECYKNTTLAALTQNNTVAFYDYLTGTLLSRITLSDPVPTMFNETEKYLSISPNKKNLLVATQEGHLIIPLSLDTQYGQGMEKLATIFLLLKPFLSIKD